jgi:formamidopyrimidine-DNA glycosylase
VLGFCGNACYKAGMPELPEVETVRQGLAPVMEGAAFARVEQRRADLRFPLPERFAARLEGRRVERLDRRAKYILVHLDDGEILAMHLGMSGRFIVSAPGAIPGKVRGGFPSGIASKQEGGDGMIGEFVHETGGGDKHDHVIFEMSNLAVIRYNDPRRFGYMTLIGAGELAAHPHFRDLGIEPLGDELTPSFLAAKGQGRRQPLKGFLLDQHLIAGLGNIYVCEALHRAALSPETPAAALALASGKPSPAAKKLAPMIRAVLDDALAAGGSSLRDYRQADGSLGYFQHRFAVYDREGKSCLKKGCRGTIMRTVQNGRSTFYCSACQKIPKPSGERL